MQVNVVRPKCTIISSRNLPPVSPQSANDQGRHHLSTSRRRAIFVGPRCCIFWAEMEGLIESTNVSEFQLRILKLISGGLGGTYQLYV